MSASLEEGFLERAAYAITSPTDFICVPTRLLLRETFQSPIWNLRYHVVDCWFEGSRGLCVMCCDLIDRITHGKLAAIFAIGKPVASKLEPERRHAGFISITLISPFSGFTQTDIRSASPLHPPCELCESPMSRISWYSRSVRVWGATVSITVWTPMGSKFSIEQMITTLYADHASLPAQIPSNENRSSIKTSASAAPDLSE